MVDTTLFSKLRTLRAGKGVAQSQTLKLGECPSLFDSRTG